MKFQLNKVITLSLLMVAGACSLPTEAGPQPSDIVETEFEPGMNVFGIVRADSVAGSSFIHIERAYHLEEAYDWPNDIGISDAVVTIRGLSDTTTYTFTNIENDSLDWSQYYNNDFMPVPGETYILAAVSPELPAIEGITIVPPSPILGPDGITVTDGSLTLHLEKYEDVGLYDLYLTLQNKNDQEIIAQMPARIMVGVTEEVRYTFTFTSDMEPILVEAYAFDAKLTEYLTTPISIRQQTYQNLPRLVENGYGVFGSVSYAKFVVSGR